MPKAMTWTIDHVHRYGRGTKEHFEKGDVIILEATTLEITRKGERVLHVDVSNARFKRGQGRNHPQSDAYRGCFQDTGTGQESRFFAILGHNGGSGTEDDDDTEVFVGTGTGPF